MWRWLCLWMTNVVHVMASPWKQAGWFTASVSPCFSPALSHPHCLPSDLSDIPEVPVCLPSPHRESRQCGTSPLRSCWPEIALMGLRLRNAPSHRWSSTSCSGVCFWMHAGTEGQGEWAGQDFCHHLPKSWPHVTVFSSPLHYGFHPLRSFWPLQAFRL